MTSLWLESVAIMIIIIVIIVTDAFGNDRHKYISNDDNHDITDKP